MSDDDALSTQPANGDFVIVLAPIAHPHVGRREWLVVRWGAFQIADVSGQHPDMAEARAHARILAQLAGREAWDSTVNCFLRLRRAPLVYRTDAGTYTVSADLTEGDGPPATMWQSFTGLNETEVRRHLHVLGFPGAFALVLLALPRRSGGRP